MKQPIFFYFVHYADKHDEIYSTYIHDKSCKLLANFLQYYCRVIHGDHENKETITLS